MSNRKDNLFIFGGYDGVDVSQPCYFLVILSQCTGAKIRFEVIVNRLLLDLDSKCFKACFSLKLSSTILRTSVDSLGR